MAVEIIINGESTTSQKPGASLFDHAEQLNVRVPTSCRKQGKCRECLMEVEEGMELLSPPSKEEAHLADKFRLSCRCSVIGEEGRVVCHTSFLLMF